MCSSAVTSLTPAQRAEGLDRYRTREHELDLVVGEVAQRFRPINAGKLAAADDGHAIARLLHLGQDVRAQEDGAALFLGLADDRVELLLDERVEAACRLIEEQQVGPVLEGDDQPDLLLVALGQLPELARRVDLEALDQLLLVGTVDAAAQVGEVVERLTAGQLVVQRELARQVAQAAVDGDRILGRVDAEDRRPAAGRTDVVEQRPDHRGLAGAVGPEEAKRLALADFEVDVDDPAVLAVVLGQLLGLDDGCHWISFRAQVVRVMRTIPGGSIPRPGAKSLRARRALAREPIRR